MKKVTKLLLVASVAALGTIGFNACGDSVTVVEPAPPPPPEPPPPGAEPAVSIKSVTTGVTFIPVNPAAVVGQIDVTLNVEPGDGNTLQKVAILIDGEEVNSQTVTGSVQQKGEGLSLAVAPSEIILSYNTAQIVDGAARWLNEQHALTATMTTDAGTLTAAAVDLTFNNANLTGVIGFTGNSASAAGGATWFGNDDILASHSPIIYSVTKPTVTYTLAGGCVFATGAGGNSVTATLTEDGNKVTYSATIPKAANLGEFPGCVLTASSTASNTPTLNLDNLAPAGPAPANYTYTDGRNAAAVVGGAPNGWANGSTTFGLTALDGGIGTLVFTLNEAVPVAPAFGIPASFDVGDEVSNGADLGESANGADTKWVLTTALEDGLGNETAAAALGPDNACSQCSSGFTVDLTAPVLSGVAPVGVTYLRPDDGTFGVSPADEIFWFTMQDVLSGLNTSGAGIGVTASRTNLEVDDSTGEICDLVAGFAPCALSVPPPADGTPTPSSHAIVLAGVSTNTAFEDAYAVAAQVSDMAGNIATGATGFTVDITSPAIAFTSQQANISVPGAASATASYAGTFSDANGIGSALVTGYLGAFAAGPPPACGGAVFTPADANIDVINLGLGPAFTFNYTLLSQGAGALSNYCYDVAVSDMTKFITGATAGNPSQVFGSHTTQW
jgi:hypothetical protein